ASSAAKPFQLSVRSIRNSTPATGSPPPESEIRGAGQIRFNRGPVPVAAVLTSDRLTHAAVSGPKPVRKVRSGPALIVGLQRTHLAVAPEIGFDTLRCRNGT